MSYLFNECSSLVELPDISKWNIKNISNLNGIFNNCSLLTFIPNIKWIFNKKIKINDIFKGCDSLLSIPDISKWNVEITEELHISSFNSNTISFKDIKSDSIISKDNIDYSYSANNEENKSDEDNNSVDTSNNDDLDNYYDNFYN